MKGSQKSSSSTLNSQLSQRPLQSSKTCNPNNYTPQSSSLLTSSFTSRSKTSVQKQDVHRKRVLSDEDDNYQVIKEQRERASSSESSSSSSFDDDDEILPAKRNKNNNASGRSRGNRSRSRSNQSGLITTTFAELQQKNTKKRKIDEISTASGGGAFTTFNNLQKNSQLYKQNYLWIEKYAP